MKNINFIITITFFLKVFLVSFSFSNDANTLLIKDPELIASHSCKYPVNLLKKGISGNVLLDIYLSNTGKITDVDIVKGVHPILDSLAQNSALNFLFSPAIGENGNIPVIISFQYSFDLKQILKQGFFSPNFTGIIKDKVSGEPISGLPVVCHFTDTTIDTAISIPFYDYIDLLGMLPGQYVIDNKLIAKTDKFGSFSFQLLPSCSLKITLNHNDYSLFKTTIAINHKKRTESLFQLTDRFDYNDEEKQYEIIVYGKETNSEIINVDNAELQYGLTNDINNIISIRPEINQMPEKSSALLVYGGSIYDNRYEVGNVPMFSPSHFSVDPNLDISGTALSTIKDITCITSNIGGRYPQTPGCVVLLMPGINRTANSNWKKRPELNVNMSQILFDFVFSVPVRKKKDLLQLSFKLAHDTLVKIFGRSNNSAFSGYGPECFFGDGTISSENNFNKIKIKSHFWLAWDAYSDSEFNKKIVFPWGMGNVIIESAKNPEKLKVTMGGSSQIYFEGNIMGKTAPLKEINRKNITLFIESDSIPLGRLTLDCNERIEYLLWDGKVVDRFLADSTANHIKESGSGKELHIQSHLGISNLSNPIFTYGINFLFGTIFERTTFFIDPGIWFKIDNNNRSIELSSGIVSDYPDIRGLPTDKYRLQINKTYTVTTSISQTIRNNITISLKPYIRWRDKCPALSTDHNYHVWDKSLESNFFSRGFTYSINATFKHIDAKFSGNIGRANRVINKKHYEYKWEIPWSLKSFIHLRLHKDMIHFHLNTHVSAGVPYRDITQNNKLVKPKAYFRPDISFEYHTKEIKHRYLTRYDIYIGVKNITNFSNPGEVYWDSKEIKYNLNLKPRTFYFGGRFCFRH